MYDALMSHQDSKRFESYLKIRNRITNECKGEVEKTLNRLDLIYKKTGTEQALMVVLRSMLKKNEKLALVEENQC